MAKFRNALWTAGAFFSLVGCGNAREAAPTEPASTEALRTEAHALTGAASDYDPLIGMVGDAHFVLLGEATHGTHEFYRERARISQRLIGEKGFAAIAIEGDWPDAYRVNRYVRGLSTDVSAEQALGGFNQFPLWMWNNADVRDLAQSLRAINAARPAGAARVGFYGLDVYSLYRSIAEVIRYLDQVDPAAAGRARTRYACFGDLTGSADPQTYGARSSSAPCTQQATAQWEEMRARAAAPAGSAAAEELFSAQQNARVVKNAEEYFRVLYTGGGSTWNLRDRHMAETLDALAAHLGNNGQPARIAVWAHNSHVGDARAADIGSPGEWNIGQLVRERHPGDAVLVGFTTYTGTVRAASEWGGAGVVKQVRPALAGSYEALFHQVGIPNFLLILRGTQAGEVLRFPQLERAIGVLYLPESERASHYFTARLADQFDAVIHWDQTQAIQPLNP